MHSSLCTCRNTMSGAPDFCANHSQTIIHRFSFSTSTPHPHIDPVKLLIQVLMRGELCTSPHVNEARKIPRSEPTTVLSNARWQTAFLKIRKITSHTHTKHHPNRLLLLSWQQFSRRESHHSAVRSHPSSKIDPAEVRPSTQLHTAIPTPHNCSLLPLRRDT
jgi:hypothetical protein